MTNVLYVHHGTFLAHATLPLEKTSGGAIRKKSNNQNIKIMNIKPLADRVLVLPAEAEVKTASGIIIPDTAKEKPLKGEVVAAGEGTKDEKMVLKKGDKVLYGKYSGTELEIEGTKYLIMRQSDVLAIVE